MQEKPRVHIYQGSLGLVGKSGVGQAARHQAAALECAGIPLVQNWPQETADVVHINTLLPASFFAARRARRRGEFVVWYGHSTEEDFKHSFTGSDLLSPLFRHWLCLCYRQANLIITPTPYAAGLLQGYGLGKPVRAVSNGVDTAFFAPSSVRRTAFRQKYGLAENEKAVISVGHFMQRKGILEFISLARRMPEYRFFWFGHTSPALTPQKIRAAMAAAPANLLFAGFVDQAALRDAYCGADAFVFCSHEETEGIVVLEALACSVPTLVRDIPVYRCWLRDSENVYKAKDQKGFYHALKGILEHGLPDVTAAGRRTAMERSLPVIGAQLAALYPEFMPV